MNNSSVLKNKKPVKILKKSSTRKSSRKNHKAIKKILVPIDGSKNSLRALDMAISLAIHYKASITGVYIFDLPITLEYASMDPVGQRLKKKVSKTMDLAESRSKKEHVPFNYLIHHAKTGPGIIEIATKGKFDVIVIGKRNISSIGEIFLGSISHYIVHHSKIPIFIVK